MLIIRDKQMDAFRGYMLEQFADIMAAHLVEYYPRECEALGQQSLLDTIHFGIKRAGGYKIVIEQDVSRYINLMFTFGKHFDVNPALSWAAAILNDPGLSGSSRMDRLYEEAEKQLSRNAGQGNPLTRGER